MKFRIDLSQIQGDDLYLTDQAVSSIPAIEEAINRCFVSVGDIPIQHGRVIALRHTDRQGLSSAFSSSLYMGKYDDANNVNRLYNIIESGHSFDALRGESISFLFIGVSKVAYDHLVSYTVRNRRICGGMRANAPWGFVIPTEAQDKNIYIKNMKMYMDIYMTAIKQGETTQAARALLPASFVFPPFQIDFNEEALAKHVFKQRIWQAGAQGETKNVVFSMYQCCKTINPDKWQILEKSMKEPHMNHRIMTRFQQSEPDAYQAFIEHYSVPEKSMWDKIK